jgi:hypothetical protein
MVTDANGAAVTGVRIEATNIANNYKYVVTSNETGQYTVTGLLNGTYKVRANGPGFAEFVAENIFLVEREARRLDIGLKLGAVETRVEVAAGSQLIETETARIADVKEHAVLETIPMFLRRTVDLMLMSPMVIKPPSGYNGSISPSRPMTASAPRELRVER